MEFEFYVCCSVEPSQCGIDDLVVWSDESFLRPLPTFMECADTNVVESSNYLGVVLHPKNCI